MSKVINDLVLGMENLIVTIGKKISVLKVTQ
jgi:hypothetical protein